MKITLSLKNCNTLILTGLLIAYSNVSASRTLIFQSESETKSSNQTHASVSKTSTGNTLGNSDVNLNTLHAQPVTSSANSELFFMIEQLQQEVNTLRGLLEEQSYELRMLKQSGKDRYQDLDTRLLDITKRLTARSAPPTTSLPTKAPVPVAELSPSNQATTISVPVKSREPTAAENDDYQKAYALIKDKKFDESIIALFGYTENHPDSPLIPNVYYWLGEVYLATSKLEQAKTSFTLVISAYPNSQKTPDSLYKLAVTSDKLGDSTLAKQYVAEVKSKYPNSTAAKLAESYSFME